MTTKHSADLDHALAEALHEADQVDFKVIDRDTLGPTRFMVVAWLNGDWWFGVSADRGEALTQAMEKLRAATEAMAKLNAATAERGPR